MTSSLAKRATTYVFIAVAALPLGGAAWETCDRVAVRPAVNPIVLRPNGCSFKDLSDPWGRSLGILAREGAVYWATHVPAPDVTDPCVITHNDGTWDVALVDPGVIDGRAGRTVQLYDHCPNAETQEADIMISVNLNFDQADQRHFINSSTTTGAGRGAMLHEYGHAVGLEHSDAEFGVMRSALAIGMPMGGHTNTGSPHYFMADDSFGLTVIGGIPRRLPNFYVTAQVLLPDSTLRDADINPGTGAAYANPLPVRTRQIIVFSAGAGVHDWWGRKVALRAYADADSVCTPLPDVGTTLGVAVVSLAKFATASGTFMVSIPALGPSGQVLNVHVAGNLIPAPFQGDETRGWDDCATTGLRILTP